jgi:hypothetical protein
MFFFYFFTFSLYICFFSSVLASNLSLFVVKYFINWTYYHHYFHNKHYYNVYCILCKCIYFTFSFLKYYLILLLLLLLSSSSSSSLLNDNFNFGFIIILSSSLLRCYIYCFFLLFRSYSLFNWALGCWVSTQINNNWIIIIIITIITITGHRAVKLACK